MKIKQLHKLFNIKLKFARPGENEGDSVEESTDKEVTYDPNSNSDDVFDSFGLVKKNNYEIEQESKNKFSPDDDSENVTLKRTTGTEDETEDKPEADNDESGDDEKPEPDTGKKYKINKEEYSQEQLAEMVMKEYDIASGVLSKKALDKLIDDYVNSKNLKKAKSVINDGHRANAKTREQLAEQKRKLDEQEKQLQQFEEDMKKRFQDNNAIIEKKYEDEDDDYYLNEDKRFEIAINKREAKKELESIKSQEEKAKKVKESIDIQREELEIRSMIYDLQEQFPELDTEGDVEKLLNQFENDVINDDTRKAYAIINVIRDFKNATVKPKSITKFYEVNENRYNVLIPALSSAKEIGIKEPEIKQAKRTIIDKQKENPPEPKQIGITKTSKYVKSKEETLRTLGAN